MQWVPLNLCFKRNSCENSWYESPSNAPENCGCHLSGSSEILEKWSLLNSLKPTRQNPPVQPLYTVCPGWIFSKLNVSKPNYLTGCLRSFPLCPLIIFGFIADMLVVRSSPRNAVGLVRKYFGCIVYVLAPYLASWLSECSAATHSGSNIHNIWHEQINILKYICIFTKMLRYNCGNAKKLLESDQFQVFLNIFWWRVSAS